MLTKEDYMHIEEQLKRGVYQKDIAHDLGVHPKTIRRAIKRGARVNRFSPRLSIRAIDMSLHFVTDRQLIFPSFQPA